MTTLQPPSPHGQVYIPQRGAVPPAPSVVNVFDNLTELMVANPMKLELQVAGNQYNFLILP
jgi:hypothetical protein